MPYKLKDPQAIPAVVITENKITSFAINLVDNELHIGYDSLGANQEILIRDQLFTLSDQAVVDTISNASEYAGVDIYEHLKKALYDALPADGVVI